MRFLRGWQILSGNEKIEKWTNLVNNLPRHQLIKVGLPRHQLIKAGHLPLISLLCLIHPMNPRAPLLRHLVNLHDHRNLRAKKSGSNRNLSVRSKKASIWNAGKYEAWEKISRGSEKKKRE